MKSKFAAKTTVADPAEDQYDVKYVKLDLAMTNTSTAISGSVTTKAVTTAATMAAYVFELIPALVIDSVLIDGTLQPVTGTGVVRTVVFPSPITAGTPFTAQVFYHGAPVSGSGFDGGLSCLVSPSWGARATFTLSESYHANNWWPCKQSLKDKIDSSDIWLTVADSLKAGSNGLLSAITPMDATHNRYEWKERYPIDYYLISAAVAPYVDYSYYMHFSGSTDSMLVQNYVYSNPATLPYFKNVIDSTGLMINYFSKLYGRYPFWQEKYGHCMARLNGGMEHQTMTTLGFFEGTLVAHELGHQWFGDNVTCATWADIVMNEGFAGYSEYLFIDHFRNHTKANQDIISRQQDVKTMAGGTVFVDDTTSEARIFDSRLTYNKGACVLHMLRSVISDDSTYFHIFRTYQHQMKDSTATILDFANVVKGIAGPVVNGINIDQFFNEWMFQEGFPLYSVSWNQVGSDVYIKLDQSTTVPSSVPFFTLPVQIKLHTPTGGDTVVKVLNNAPSQIFHFTWDKLMTSLAMDPNYWLVYEVSALTHDATLDVKQVRTAAISVSPNPTSGDWTVDHLTPNSKLTLVDISGRTIWHAENPQAGVTIPAGQLVPGLYLLRVSNDKETSTLKLIKK
jgi:aminopeptidase N